MAHHLKIASIILAAGKGSRMGLPDKQKVCFPIAGTPAIVRSMRTYDSLGISPHVVVVGHGAEQVMEMVSAEFEDAIFAYQTEQRGTGHATKIGVRTLKDFDYTGDILVVAGDKIIEPTILSRLILTFYEQKSDLTFIVGNSRDFTDAGRVIASATGQPLAVVEVFDLKQNELLQKLWKASEKAPVEAATVEGLARQLFPKEKKRMLALGSLWQHIERGESIHRHHLEKLTGGVYPQIKIRNECELDAMPLKNNELANLSVYLFRAPALYTALDSLSSDNAQQEEYLTDVVHILAGDGHYSMHIVTVDDPHQVMAFNNQEELQAINRYIRSQEIRVHAAIPPVKLHRPSQWLQALDNDDMIRFFERLYNGNQSLAMQKISRLKQLLIQFKQEYGNVEATIARAPGRVNLMGRHIDHQGGDCNLIAIDREIFLVAARRKDDVVDVSNLDRIKFPRRKFRMIEYLNRLFQTNWLDYVNSDVAQRIEKGDWSNYIKAAYLRFQAHFPDHRFKGLNIMVSGDIPIAAGLSSSSAVVVATAEALVALNQLPIEHAHFVERCGEGEWFVGTRGGCADHAAMKMGRRGQVVNVSFHPFQINEILPFPDDHLIVICDSHIKAYKSAASRTIFNQRVACYHLGRLLIKKFFPQLAPRIEFLRDISPERLGLELADFYRMIGHLPGDVTQDQLKELLPERQTEPIFASHPEYVGAYPIRDIVLFGISECDRSRRSPALLKESRITDFGKLMKISHNGDRIVRFDDRWNESRYSFDCSESYFHEIESISHHRDGKAALYLQSGSYRCSTPEIDLIVDLANAIRGVKGAQISGAGLGGCAMVMVEDSAVEELIRTLTDKYYATSDLEPTIAICTPVAGSGVLEF